MQPQAFFAALPRQGNYASPLIFALICTLIGSAISGLLGLFYSHGIGGLITGLIGAAIGTAIGIFTAAAIAQFLVTIIVGQTHSGFEASLRVVAYS